MIEKIRFDFKATYEKSKAENIEEIRRDFKALGQEALFVNNFRALLEEFDWSTGDTVKYIDRNEKSYLCIYFFTDLKCGGFEYKMKG